MSSKSLLIFWRSSKISAIYISYYISLFKHMFLCSKLQLKISVIFLHLKKNGVKPWGVDFQALNFRFWTFNFAYFFFDEKRATLMGCFSEPKQARPVRDFFVMKGDWVEEIIKKPGQKSPLKFPGGISCHFDHFEEKETRPFSTNISRWFIKSHSYRPITYWSCEYTSVPGDMRIFLRVPLW